MLALVAGIHPKVLSKKIKLRRPLPSGLRPCALHGMKVLLDLKCKGVQLLVNEAFSKKRTPLPEHGSGYRQAQFYLTPSSARRPRRESRLAVVPDPTRHNRPCAERVLIFFSKSPQT